MHFHMFGPPPPHLLPIILSSALAFAGGAYLMTRQRYASKFTDFGAKVRDGFALWRSESAPASGVFSRGAARTVNTAFDSYRAESLSQLETEAAEFRAYLDSLRGASDRAEFEAFVSQRKQTGDATGAG
ncbi:MAG: DUF2852 domain-containing protein [Hyphomicrobium sp.]